MKLFSTKDRAYVFDRTVLIARQDPRVTGGAIVGSRSTDTQDSWSDIDITFGIKSNIDIKIVLNDWTRLLEDEFGMVHYFDLQSGSAIYRVILFPNCLELDLSVVPEKDFGSRSPNFRLLFGTTVDRSNFPKPSVEELIGFGWHHIIHANAAIRRGRNWQAEYWISGARDNILALQSMRFGEDARHARSVHLLPAALVAQFEDTLVRSTEINELQRALKAVSMAFIEEVKANNNTYLAQRLEESLMKCLMYK